MNQSEREENDPDTPCSDTACLRIDRLLVYLRFARTRSGARDMIEGRSLRLNRKHVLGVSEAVGIGDVLTVMVGSEVRVVEIMALPDRRASPAVAKTLYRDLTKNNEF